MTLRAVFFDLGGVIVRTEDSTPRRELARRLGLSYEQLVQAVFESPTSLQATLGTISTEGHWLAVGQSLGLDPQAVPQARQDFFAGDRIDLELIDYLRRLRPRCRTGLISNAWPDLRDYIVEQKFDDAFDCMIISSELGMAKPAPEIYRVALDWAGVQPGEAAFVDDMPSNLEGARVLGMHVIQFRSTPQVLSEIDALLKVE